MAKRNDKPRTYPPKGIVPEQFKSHLFKPGNQEHKKARRKTVRQEMLRMLGDQVTLEDGRVVSGNEAAARIFVNKMLRGPDKESTHDSNWQYASTQVLSRVDPIPRENVIEQEASVHVKPDSVSIAFVNRLIERYGTPDPSEADVLAFIDEMMDNQPLHHE